MRRQGLAVIIILACLALPAFPGEFPTRAEALPMQVVGGEVQSAAPDRSGWAPAAGIMYIENVGQFAPDARYQVRGAGAGPLWLADDALWFSVGA